MFLRQGRLPDGTRLTSADTVSLMVSRHRTGQFDLTLQHIIDFGLGVIINSNQYGADTVPYGFGKYCSPNTFGHGGSQCSIGFCDPERELVVAWAANGFCGEGQHQRRNRAINEAIYRDLSIC
jgi:CubicO group peptidase (beta-lactamase class C family)